MYFNGMGEDSTHLDDLRALVARLALDFSDLDLLDQALTHASAVPELPHSRGNNESLEFLGDAVLGMAVAEWLYEQVPGRSPGEYTQMRARVVNRDALAAVARRLNIAPAIRLGKGEETHGGRKRKALLADCMEAIIGAAYLHCGWDAVRELVGRAFSEELDVARHSKTEWDFRSRLQNYCQAEGLSLPEFVVVREEGPDHKKEFEVAVSLRGEVVGGGVGATKKEAEQRAARAALEYEGQQLG